jgi:hypothetical protein
MPLSNDTFTPSSIISLAQDELILPILKLLLATRGGYYDTYLDYDPTDTGLYILPSDATGGALTNIEMVQGPTIIQVNEIEESEQFSTNSPTSTTYGFFFKGNYVQILPTPPVGNVRLWFSKRPSQLVLTSACGQITNINATDPTQTVYTLTNIPSTFVVGTLLDACGDQPPFNIFGGGFITDITGTDVTILGLPFDGLTVGDWMCLNNQTCIPQIPVEFRTVLEQSTIVTMYEIQGMLEKKKSAESKLELMKKDVTTLITPRTKSQTKVIMCINGGFLNGTANRTWNFQAGKQS